MAKIKARCPIGPSQVFKLPPTIGSSIGLLFIPILKANCTQLHEGTSAGILRGEIYTSWGETSVTGASTASEEILKSKMPDSPIKRIIRLIQIY